MDLLLDFTAKLSEIIEVETIARAREALNSVSTRERPRAVALSVRAPLLVTGAAGASAAAPAVEKRPRKKPPRQVCPVPGCTNTAAPIFGMVCSKHKDVPKAKIEKYREARRAKKAKK